MKFVSCPQCGTQVRWDPANPYRPFCSERCKLIDLGAWAEESYRIPVAEHKVEPDTDSREQDA
ncbi:MAG: DNA gyrase inhibitor YacG [Burkholderiales bacterium]|nr:DNA gyrase inhibitor YacG [Burkholderiales bacterium]